MKRKILLVGPLVAAALAMVAWFSWHWYTTPIPPTLSLDGAEPAVVKAVEGGLAEVRAQPRSGAAWGRLAMILIANGYGEQALPCLAHAQQFDPENPHWPYYCGTQLLILTKPEAGIPLLEQALRLAQTPNQRVAILWRLATHLIEAGRFADAEGHIRALDEIESESPRVHLGYGLLSMSRGDRAAARKHLSMLTESPFARKTANMLLAGLPGSDEEVTRNYQELAAQLPSDFAWPDPLMAELGPLAVHRGTRFTQVQGLMSEGRIGEAMDLLRQLAKELSDPELYHNLGEILVDLNELPAAEEMLRTAIHLDAADMYAHYYLGLCLLKRAEQRLQEPGGKDAAVALFQSAVEAEDVVLAARQNHGKAHSVRGRALRRLGRADEALVALRAAVHCRAESAEAHLELGEALAESGRLLEGLDHLEDAVRLAGPTDARARDVLKMWRTRANPE